MQYFSSRKFDKKFANFPEKMKNQFIERIKIFIQNPYNSTLNNHALHGIYLGCRSINISGNLRAIYKIQDNNIALFIDIDNHGNLYK